MARAGKVVLPVLLMAMTAGSLIGPGHLTKSFNEAANNKAAQTWTVQDVDKADKKAESTPAAAKPAADTAKAQPVRVSLSQAIDIMTIQATAKAKPAVVKIFSGNALGSGYIISADGIVISNAHVTGAAEVGDILNMEFSDGTTGKVKVLAFNHNKDIAILQLPAKEGGWPFIPLGDSKKLSEGQGVLAMGYPLGLPFTVTRGIISGIGGGRGSIYVQQIQTDAAINHGNSGGALINMDGEVIAMNTAIAAPTPESGSIGIGFSITSEDIKAALSQYAAMGNINTSWIGIIVNQANPTAPDQGVLIEVVRPGSPADKAGLRGGDLLLGAEKHRFDKGPRGLEALARTIAQHKPGEKIEVLVARQGDVAPVAVTLANEPGSPTAVAAPAATTPAAPAPAPAPKPSLWGRFTGALSEILRAIFSGLSPK
jgi:S1-C subfamily serine protease